METTGKGKPIHTKTKLYDEVKYLRQLARQADELIAKGDWTELQHVFLELSGMAGNCERYALDNAQGIEDYDYKSAWEIEEIRAGRDPKAAWAGVNA